MLSGDIQEHHKKHYNQYSELYKSIGLNYLDIVFILCSKINILLINSLSMFIKFTIFFVFLISFSSSQIFSHSDGMQTESVYDSVYAKKLGADDYGMKTYIMAFLRSGKVSSKDKEESQRLQMEHLNNIVRLAEEGVLVLAGPFMSSDQDIRGIYIFDVTTIEEAKKLTETDPAIQAGVLEMELIPWYGSAALVELNNIHKKIQKISITDQ